MNSIFPKYFTKKAIGLYVILLLIISFLFLGSILPIHWMLFGLIEVSAFFHFSNLYSKRWNTLNEKMFIKKLFQTALIIRIGYVIFSYFFYQFMNDTHFEFSAADSFGYHNEAMWIVELIQQGQFNSVYIPYINGNYSDAGYPVYLSAVYYIFDNSIIVARIIKAILSAYSCVLIYKIAKSNFGEQTGKIAGILALLFPSFIYYCGLHVKETEMIFLVVLFIERTEFFIRNKSSNLKYLFLALGLAISLFFFRTVAGVTAFFALFSYLVFSSSRLKDTTKKIAVGFWMILTILIFLGGGISKEVSKYWEDRETNQQVSMQTRANATTGNKFAKYGQTAIFSPFILIAPFPTMVNVEVQQNQMMLHGGFFVKNTIAFFIFLALFVIYKSRTYKKHVLFLAFLFCYLGIIALSKFAISERFHMPAYPILIVLAAYGISNVNLKNSKYYIPYLILIGLIIIGWNWFKLAGRGQV